MINLTLVGENDDEWFEYKLRKDHHKRTVTPKYLHPVQINSLIKKGCENDPIIRVFISRFKTQHVNIDYHLQSRFLQAAYN